MRSPGLLLALGLVACETRPVEVRQQSTETAETGLHQAPDIEVERARIVVRALATLELDPLEARESACNDEALKNAAPTPKSRVLSLRFAEARPEAKALLPMSVSEALESPLLPRVEQDLSGVHGAASRAAALELSSRLGRQRFVGVLHVTQLGMPKWIWRLDRKKPEWVAGYLESWLAIHDAQSGERMCQTRIWVRNDTSEAPLKRRLRADTRDQLTRELGTSLAREAASALQRLTSVLQLPPKPSIRKTAAGAPAGDSDSES